MRFYFFRHARRDLDLAPGLMKPSSIAGISQTDSNAVNIQFIRENLIATISNTTVVRYCQESPTLNPHATHCHSIMADSIYGLSVCQTYRQPRNAQFSNMHQQINSRDGGLQQDVLKAVFLFKTMACSASSLRSINSTTGIICPASVERLYYGHFPIAQ